jgi:hypothetical protein
LGEKVVFKKSEIKFKIISKKPEIEDKINVVDVRKMNEA